MFRTSLFRLLSFILMLLSDVSITSSFFRTFKNSFQLFSQVMEHLTCCPSFVFFFLGKQGCAVVRTLASHQCDTGGWLSSWFYPSRDRLFSGYSSFHLSVQKQQLLPNTISNWNAETRAYWELKAITLVELIFRDFWERGPQKNDRTFVFIKGKLMAFPL